MSVFLFQDFLLFDELSTSQYIAIPASYLPHCRRAQIAINAQCLLRELGLADKEHHSARYLSGGERQRTAIARALVNNPYIILADEPAASLDKNNAQMLINHLRKLAYEQGKTVVLISHDPVVQQQADRLIKIENGLLVASREANAE